MKHYYQVVHKVSKNILFDQKKEGGIPIKSDRVELVARGYMYFNGINPEDCDIKLVSSK